MSFKECGFPLEQGARTWCRRPAGHTRWSINAGWPLDTVAAHAHCVNPMPYDAEVAPYMPDTERSET